MFLKKTFSVFIFAALVANGLSAVTSISPEKFQQKFFVNNPSSRDYKLFGKNDEHRYGVELKENDQFHHTTTGKIKFDYRDCDLSV